MKTKTQKTNVPAFAFFGSSRFSVIVLEALERRGILPAIIVTTPDKPQGRKMTVTPTPVKVWALARKINVHDAAKLDATFVSELKSDVNGTPNVPFKIPVFIVASYGKIIPQTVLDIPAKGTLNIHPSLLPQYRGASPLQTAILDDMKNTGVTIMNIDAEMDHGPIVIQKKVHIDEWPTYEEFETLMANAGAELLAEALPAWCEDMIEAVQQDHAKATFTKKIKKEDGLIDISILKSDFEKEQYLAFRKIQAYHEWPQAYFFIEHNGKQIRVKITAASWQKAEAAAHGQLVIEKVIPEGGKEILFEDFKRGYKI